MINNDKDNGSINNESNQGFKDLYKANNLQWGIKLVLMLHTEKR